MVLRRARTGGRPRRPLRSHPRLHAGLGLQTRAALRPHPQMAGHHPMNDVADDKGSRRAEAEATEDETQRLKTVLYQALDEWLRAYIAGQMKVITLQPSDS